MSASPIAPQLAPPGGSASPPPAPGTRPAKPMSSAPADGVAAGARLVRGTTDAHRRDALVTALIDRVPPADRPAARTAIPAILDAARRAGTNDPNRIGYLLATAQTETDFGSHMTEVGHSKAWYDENYGCDDGNRPGTDDGYRYRGRGYVQTTREGRYAELSRELGLPEVRAVKNGRIEHEPALVAQPDRLAEPRLAARALVVGVEKNLFTHNPKTAIDTTIPVGKPPGAVDFYHARGIVNGIVRDQADSIAHRATEYAQILDAYRTSVLGIADVK